MKIEKIRLAPIVPLLISLLGLLPARAADTVVVFGLTNQSINGANLSPPDSRPGVHVDDLSYLGYKGLSVRLGQAESGLFFSPQVNGSLQDTNFMLASAFGRVSGLDRRICSVAGWRETYGTYPVSVDFLPLGALSQTFQVYCDDMLVREETNRTGTVIFDTSNDGNLYPRVNPFWRAPDGQVGVLIEINRSTIKLPGGKAYGNRVFIKPEHPLFSVDYVSRVDVFGGGGLPNFEAWGEALGVFHLPHTALGAAVFTARLHELRVGGLNPGGDDGVMVELGGASAYEMRLQPLALPTNALVQISALGVGDYYYLNGHQFLGPVGLQNVDGTVRVYGTLGNNPTNRIRLGVFNHGVFAGGATNEGGVCGTIPAGDWKVAACGALPNSSSDPSSIYMTFDQPVTFQPTAGGDPITGNQLRFSWHDPGADNGSFRNFQLQAAGVPAFVLTNGLTTPAPPLQLSIVESGGQVQVSWPYLNAYNYLEIGYEANGASWFTPAYGVPELVGSRWQWSQPVDEAPQQFFRLNNYCILLNSYLNHD